MIEEESE